MIDVVASGIALVILSPVMVIIGLLIKRDRSGPVLFKQTRVGLGGRTFQLLKFRTMTVEVTSGGPLVTTAGDSRVTPLGRRLRSTKADELPQLVNVLVGDMSLAGPRPEVPRYVALWPSDDRSVILSVRPGITDPTTLSLRREEELLAQQASPETYYREVLLPAKAAAYRRYVESRTLAGDISLLARTVARVFLN